MMSFRQIMGVGAVVLMAAAAIVSGCGGGDETTALTKAQFIKQADAVCKGVDAAQEASLLKYTETHPEASASPGEQEETIRSVGLPPVRNAIGEISELPAPAADQDKVDAIIEGMEKALREAEGEPLSIMATPTSPSPFRQVDEMAEDFGFHVCNEIL